MTKRRTLLVLLPLFTLAGCDLFTGPEGPPARITSLPREMSAAEVRVVVGSNAFAFDFLRELVVDREGPNVFTSPLSASMAFGMAMNGAAGETWTQMRDVLGFDGMTEEEINHAYRDLIDLLLGLDGHVTFGLANSVWVREEFEPLPDFMQRLETWFAAEARAVDFTDPATVDVINDWVAGATAGRIEDLIEVIPPDMIMYLINAIYFNGDWRHRFDPGKTANAPFTTLSGGTAQVPMMEGKAAGRTAGVDGVVIVELPYGGAAFNAVAVLPPPDGDEAGFAASLTPATWNAWMEALEAREPQDPAEATIRFPKFELEWESGLNDVMQRLGMVNAYDCRVGGSADFTRIHPAGELCIMESKQKTFLQVDEEGTEAAAATSVGIGVTSAPGFIEFDRPFLFAIRERLTGTILFLGLIGDPS